MTLLPQIRDELIIAAARRQQQPTAARGRFRLPRGVLLTIALLLGAAASASAVAIATGVIGGPPTNDFPRVAGEEQAGFTRQSAPTVLGVLRTQQIAGPIELVGYRAANRGRHQICLDLGLPDGTNGGSCSPEIPQRPHAFLGSMGTPRGRLITAATRTPVAAVVVTYTLRGEAREVAADLIKVSGPQAQRLGTQSFTFLAAPLPDGATHAVLGARDAQRRTVWRVAVDH